MREWQREGTDIAPLRTTYVHDLRGLPDTRTYSDGSAAPLDFDYDRAGRLKKVTDAGGVRTFIHEDDGQVAAETITGAGFLTGYTLTHGFGIEGHGLRDSIGLSGPSGAVATNTFDYEPETGRLLTVSQGGDTATYAYRPNTDWGSAITHNNGSSDVFTERTHRDVGGRVAGVVSRSGTAAAGAILASSGYALNAKGQREWLTREDGTRWKYGYNDRDELSSGKKYLEGEPLAGRQFEYQYDDIGNRKFAKYGGDENGNNLRVIDYTQSGQNESPNQLNQYVAITHSGIMEIVGYSPNAGLITATPNQQGSTTVQGGLEEFWRAEIKGANSSNGVWQTVSVDQNQSGIGGGDLWIPPATANPSYDLVLLS